jgi:hypothetical protein
MFSGATKIRLPLVVVALLIIPFVLTACGGEKTDNATRFLESMDKGDTDQAKAYVCDDLKDAIELMASDGADNSTNIKDINCKEDGDNVTCTFKVGDLQGQLTFIMDDDDKICGGDIFE